MNEATVRALIRRFAAGITDGDKGDISVSGGGTVWTIDAAAIAGKQDADATLTSLSGLSLAAGDVLYATAADTLARLPKGTDGQVLTLASGLPSWASGGGTVTDAMLDTGAATAAGTTWVNLRIADSAVGAVGTYAYLRHTTNNTALTAGTTYAASALRYSGVNETPALDVSAAATPSGTWRAMGTSAGTSGQKSSTLMLRIS